MQIPRVENMVKKEEQPEDFLYLISEYSLREFLENEPDLYSLSDLKVRYK